ncbi:hypothetical protein DFJ74DRAFT_713126 [Hyaloraphidium curvatum]|nr:hypothetical protein DFJ74DRAFT_713126 [Hyaloraphidium curvatum]
MALRSLSALFALVVLCAPTCLASAAARRGSMSVWREYNATDPATGSTACFKGWTTYAGGTSNSWTACPVPCAADVSAGVGSFSCAVPSNGMDAAAARTDGSITVRQQGPGSCHVDWQWQYVGPPYSTGEQAGRQCPFATCPFAYLAAANPTSFAMTGPDTGVLQGAWAGDACEAVAGCPVLDENTRTGSQWVDNTGTLYACLPAPDAGAVGMSVLVKLDAWGEVACASRNSKDCIWLPSTCCEVWSRGFPLGSGTPYVACGEYHRSVWGSPGYGDPSHWCERGRALLSANRPRQAGPGIGVLGPNCNARSAPGTPVDPDAGPWKVLADAPGAGGILAVRKSGTRTGCMAASREEGGGCIRFTSKWCAQYAVGTADAGTPWIECDLGEEWCRMAAAILA